MKSHMLREVLTDNFLRKAKSSQQWDVVRETREKILSRIQSIEEGVASRGDSHVLREELKSMKGVSSHNINDGNAYNQMLSRMQSSSLEYLNTTDDEV